METANDDDGVVAPDGAATPPEPASAETLKSLGERTVEMIPGVRENFIARMEALAGTVRTCMEGSATPEDTYYAMERTCKSQKPPFSTYYEEVALKIRDAALFPIYDDQLNLDRKLKNNVDSLATDLFLETKTVPKTLADIEALIDRVQDVAGFIAYINS